VGAITTESGVAHGLLYHYSSSKVDELARALGTGLVAR